MTAWTLVESPSALARIDAALDWAACRPSSQPLLVVSASSEAGRDFLRRAAQRAGALFGWRCLTLGQLAADLATPALEATSKTPAGRTVVTAVACRALHKQAGKLGELEPSLQWPNLGEILADTFGELRAHGVTPADMAKRRPELSRVFEAFEEELADGGLCDRSEVLRLALEAVKAGTGRLVGWPVLALDPLIRTPSEAELLLSLAQRGPAAFLSMAEGDERARGLLGSVGQEIRRLEVDQVGVGRLQAQLFATTTVETSEPSGRLHLTSAPGESRECVEIARKVHEAARNGIRFDRIAVLLRTPGAYRDHLEEAFARAGIPAYFARGATRPCPQGRALLALLTCKTEGLSASAFAEYLSLGVVPSATTEGAPPAPDTDRWVPPDDDLLPPGMDVTVDQAPEQASAPVASGPVVEGSLGVPRKWEKLLVDAAVIGSLDRWKRRLAGHAAKLRQDLARLDEPDDPVRQRIERDLEELANLNRYALPLLEDLDALPVAASWGEWLVALEALSTRAIEDPEIVLRVLAELRPMRDVAPVEIAEVLRVLRSRLGNLTIPDPSRPAGRVFVAPIEVARGMSFDVVVVPGLAERLFPEKTVEDPLLPRSLRQELGRQLPEGPPDERLLLRLAVGAAEREIWVSYPRMDLNLGRPRVPSFYLLDVVRADEGRLPSTTELAQRMDRGGAGRLGWPAPDEPSKAIDAAEYDLAVLHPILYGGQEGAARAAEARHLLHVNPHLKRAILFRANRWDRDNWTYADGLVDPDALALEALALRRPDAFSPTKLQSLANCPYQFFLAAILRLEPWEAPERIEELSPLQLGAFFAEVQFRLLSTLRDKGLLPVTPKNLPRCQEELDTVQTRVEAEYRDELAPAIERVWRSGIEWEQVELREWLKRMSEDTSGFVPYRFELAFGLPFKPGERDPASIPDPVTLDAGIDVRGSIDLVERNAGGELRAVDHKTGKPGKKWIYIEGGRTLQPVLYALALEQMTGDTVVSGMLYHCTSRHRYARIEVELDEQARDAMAVVAETLEGALEEGFLPAQPVQTWSWVACDRCDYRVVCGPDERLRTERKDPARFAAITKLRSRK